MTSESHPLAGLDARTTLQAAIGAVAAYAAQRYGLKATIPDTYEYDVIRAAYTDTLFEAFIGYASSGGAVTKWKNAAKRAIVEAFPDAFNRAHEEAGADETDDDDEKWLTGRMNEELGHLDGVFAWLKQARGEETITETDIEARVEQWAQGLDSVFSEALLRAKKNQSLEWHLGETEIHCETCARLNGQRHTAKWYLARYYIPGKPGAAMDCGGWRCLCFLTDKSGETVTI